MYKYTIIIAITFFIKFSLIAENKSSQLIYDISYWKALTEGIAKLRNSGELTKLELKNSSEKLNLELPTSSKIKMSPSQIYKQHSNSVLVIGPGVYLCKKCPNPHYEAASGFIISEDGLAITCYHVMENFKNNDIAAMTFDKKVHQIEKILRVDKKKDLVLLKLKGKGFKPLPISYNLRTGMNVSIISHPSTIFYTLSNGIVTRRYYSQENKNLGVRFFSTSADFAVSSSGGPVFDDKGNVVGIVANTMTLYDDQDKKSPDPQMVVKGCLDSQNLQKLLDE